MKPEVRQLRRAVRLVQNGAVLSESLRRPGATHSIFDLLAAGVAAFAPAGRVGLLGFAAGGMIAPMRKAGAAHAVRGVDLSRRGWNLYRAVAGDWGGEVSFAQDDALRWLRRQRGRFAALVEDLSIPRDGDVVKPDVSWERVPGLVPPRLVDGGVAIFNLLPTPGVGWGEMLDACRLPGCPAVAVDPDRFHNRILIQGRDVGPARVSGAKLRRALRRIGSRLAGEIAVWTLP